jgi:hypothetical protein
MPQHAGSNGLTVVHATLAGVIAKDTVDHDLFLLLIEPSVFATESAGCLGWGRGHPEGGNDTDQTGDQALERE